MKSIPIAVEHQITATRLLAGAGIKTLYIAGDELVLADDPADTDINAALADLEAIAAADQLADDKANALATARQMAADYHRQIAQATIERAIAWVMKALFAIAAKQAVGSTDPALQTVTDATTDAFTIEAGIGGEDAADLQARAIQKAAAFLRATALVEGMERFAEHHLTAATTQAELDSAVAQLRAQEAVAADQLTQLLEGETDA